MTAREAGLRMIHSKPAKVLGMALALTVGIMVGLFCALSLLLMVLGFVG